MPKYVLEFDVISPRDVQFVRYILSGLCGIGILDDDYRLRRIYGGGEDVKKRVNMIKKRVAKRRKIREKFVKFVEVK